MLLRAIIIVGSVLFFASHHLSAQSDTAVFSLLELPFGARSSAMGEVGTALANDESALYFNPAGLGLLPAGLSRGSVSNSFERLYKNDKRFYPRAWHNAVSGYYQLPQTYGGVALYSHIVHMANNHDYAASGRVARQIAEREYVWAAGWGRKFHPSGRTIHAFGLTGKLFHASQFPELDTQLIGDATSAAFDAGYLAIFPCGVQLGITLANMGPSINYNVKGKKEPIPFTANAAVAYTYHYYTEIKLFNFSCEMRFDKKLLLDPPNDKPAPFIKALFIAPFNQRFSTELQETNFHLGMEYGFFNTLFYRQGVVLDPRGKRYESHFGLGCNLFDHIRFDYSWTNSPYEYMAGFSHRLAGRTDGSAAVRHGQMQFTISVDGLTKWTKRDREWWKTHHPWRGL